MFTDLQKHRHRPTEIKKSFDFKTRVIFFIDLQLCSGTGFSFNVFRSNLTFYLASVKIKFSVPSFAC